MPRRKTVKKQVNKVTKVDGLEILTTGDDDAPVPEPEPSPDYEVLA